MITIDGQDILTTWKLEPQYEGFYNSLMQHGGVKERITHDFEDINGLEVLLDDSKIKSKTFNLSFICDGYSYYESFMEYLLAHPEISLFDSFTNTTYKLEYLSCVNVNRYSLYILFTLNFSESNPLDRT